VACREDKQINFQPQTPAAVGYHKHDGPQRSEATSKIQDAERRTRDAKASKDANLKEWSFRDPDNLGNDGGGLGDVDDVKLPRMVFYQPVKTLRRYGSITRCPTLFS
jgi:hypothetical protein